MTRSERIERLKPYISGLAGHLHLKDWRVELLDDLADRGNNAEIETISGYKTARIRLSLDFFDHPEPWRRQVLCHELVHLHLSQVDDFLRPILSNSERTTYDLLRETAVDEVAHALAPHLPVEPDPAEVVSARAKKGKGR